MPRCLMKAGHRPVFCWSKRRRAGERPAHGFLHRPRFSPIIELCPHAAAAPFRNLIGRAAARFDQPLRQKPGKDRQGAIGEHETVAGKTGDVGDLATTASFMTNASALSERVQHALLELRDIHGKCLDRRKHGAERARRPQAAPVRSAASRLHLDKRPGEPQRALTISSIKAPSRGKTPRVASAPTHRHQLRQVTAMPQAQNAARRQSIVSFPT